MDNVYYCIVTYKGGALYYYNGFSKNMKPAIHTDFHRSLKLPKSLQNLEIAKKIQEALGNDFSIEEHAYMDDPNDKPLNMLDELEAVVFECLGEASMCWSDFDKAGTFDNKGANVIANKLLKFIHEHGVTILIERLKAEPELLHAWKHNIIKCLEETTRGRIMVNNINDKISAIHEEAASRFMNMLMTEQPRHIPA